MKRVLTSMAAAVLGLIGSMAPSAQTVAPVLIPEPEIHVFAAEDGTEHQLFVALPAAYDRLPEARFPVLYVLDGNTMFAMVAQTYGYMEVFGEIGPVIIVGVGYPVDNWHDVLTRRTRDYTPTRDPAVEYRMNEAFGREDLLSGGAGAFLSTLRAHVIPLVDATYRTSETNVLAGFSFGGLFATHVLFTAPEAFSGYLVGSPSLAWDDDVTFSVEAAFARDSRSLPARVFLSSGTLEQNTAARVERLAAILAKRHYEGLELTTHLFEGETHLSVIPATLSRGLRVLLQEAAPASGR